MDNPPARTLPARLRAEQGAQTGVLAMTLVVRDEEDIIETNLRYHLAQGVDFVYAIDHNSNDGTPDILREFEQMGVLRMLREDGDVHDQAPRVTRLARLAYEELGAAWVINNDADEFWWPAIGDLKDVFSAVPPEIGVLIARRHDFVPRNDGAGPFHERMVWRHTASQTPTGARLGPKTAHRGVPDIVVGPGNHEIYAPALNSGPSLPLLEVLHFPARTYEQFARKTLNTGRGYELLTARDSGTGIDQLELLRLLRTGGLREYFDAWALSDPELERRLREGTVVHDVRLRDFLARDGRVNAATVCDRLQVADVVRGAFALDHERRAALAQAHALAAEHERAVTQLHALDTRVADLELEQTRLQAGLGDRDARIAELQLEESRLGAALRIREADVAELGRALEQVRNSRLMRSTRRLRRLYYELKRTAR